MHTKREKRAGEREENKKYKIAGASLVGPGKISDVLRMTYSLIFDVFDKNNLFCQFPQISLILTVFFLEICLFSAFSGFS